MAVNSIGTYLMFTPTGGTAVRIGSVSSIGKAVSEAEELDVTTLDSTGGIRRKIAGFIDPGSIDIEGFMDPSDGGQTALRTAHNSGAAGSFAITFPDGSGASFPAFVQKLWFGGAGVNSAIGFGVTLRRTGVTTFTQPTTTGV